VERRRSVRTVLLAAAAAAAFLLGATSVAGAGEPTRPGWSAPAGGQPAP
jgi:hypothetical protein